jgi:hypothetical protein
MYSSYFTRLLCGPLYLSPFPLALHVTRHPLARQWTGTNLTFKGATHSRSNGGRKIRVSSGPKTGPYGVSRFSRVRSPATLSTPMCRRVNGEVWSEKSRRCLRCCPTARRNGTFRSILPSVYRPNPCSERCSYPFRTVSPGTWVNNPPGWDVPETSRRGR